MFEELLHKFLEMSQVITDKRDKVSACAIAGKLVQQAAVASLVSRAGVRTAPQACVASTAARTFSAPGPAQPATPPDQSPPPNHVRAKTHVLQFPLNDNRLRTPQVKNLELLTTRCRDGLLVLISVRDWVLKQ